MTIVEQIHQEFFTASEKITGFAVPDKAKKLYDLGFTSSEDSKAFDPEREKLRNLILHYQSYYPNNKFITDKEVQRICKKYNLICGPVSAYTGKVPDSKLDQIASFKLHPIHQRQTLYEYEVTYHSKDSYYDASHWLLKDSKWHKVLPKKVVSSVQFGSTMFMDLHLNKQYNTGVRWLVDKMEETKTEYTGLYICAPEKEMKTEGLEKKGIFAMFQTKRHIEDPVVLSPCAEGWLILAAWGPEASDEDVVNHKMN